MIRHRTHVDCNAQQFARGFTLLELLLALAVMIAVLGLTWPAVGRFLGEQPIKNAVESARTGLAGTRQKSMSSGLVYQFRYEPGGDRFVVLPFELDAQQVTPGGTGQGSTVSTATPTTSSKLQVAKGRLNTDCRFASSTDANGMFAASNITTATTTERIPPELLALLSLESDKENQELSPDALSGVHWSTPILFYPDGTADDGAFSVLDVDQRTITVTLRGLTAAVSVGKMELGGRN